MWGARLTTPACLIVPAFREALCFVAQESAEHAVLDVREAARTLPDFMIELAVEPSASAIGPNIEAGTPRKRRNRGWW